MAIKVLVMVNIIAAYTYYTLQMLRFLKYRNQPRGNLSRIVIAQLNFTKNLEVDECPSKEKLFRPSRY